MISDFQLQADAGHYTQTHLTTALGIIKRAKPDLVCVVGDMTEYSLDSEIKIVSNTYDKFYKNSQVPMFYCLGNHDIVEENAISRFRNIFSDYNYRYDVENIQSTGNRHAVVNGYHFLAVHATDYHTIESNGAEGAKYAAETKTWLDKTLKQITSENPNQYVFIITHPPIYDTTWHTDRISKNWNWYTKELTEILNKYPQAIVFGGHLHYTLDAENNIWQGNFTAVNTSAVAHTCLEHGYDNLSGAYDVTATDSRDQSQGYIVYVDKNGNVKLDRYDFTQNESIKTPFYLDTPTANKSHLERYNHDNRKASNKAPTWVKKDATVKLDSVSNNSQNATINLTAASDDDMVFYYEITFIRNGETVRTIRHLTDFYKAIKVSDMETNLKLSINSLVVNSNYELQIRAVDIWGAKSEVQAVKVTTATVDDSTLPNAYVEISINGGSVTDLKKHATFENNGASITHATVWHQGKSYYRPVIALNGSKQAVLGKFTASRGSLLQKFTAGMTFEAFMLESSPTTGNLPIIAAWQNGGWGLSVQNGKLCFQVYTGESTSVGQYNRLDSRQSLSTTELTHVVGVLDNKCRQLRIYLNGIKVGELNFIGSYLPGLNNVYGHFSIGSDLNENLGFTTFSKNKIIADLKIYDKVLTDNQVKLAYQAAVKQLTAN